MTTFNFTISASFDADNKQDAWDEWCEWLRQPMHVEDGTQVQPAEPDDWEALSPEAQASWLRGMDVCNTCGGTGVWETTFEDEPTTLVSLGPCPDCGSH